MRWVFITETWYKRTRTHKRPREKRVSEPTAGASAKDCAPPGLSPQNDAAKMRREAEQAEQCPKKELSVLLLRHRRRGELLYLAHHGLVRQPRPLYQISIGRAGGAECHVPERPAADR
jgi:hypothetical protein